MRFINRHERMPLLAAAVLAMVIAASGSYGAESGADSTADVRARDAAAAYLAKGDTVKALNAYESIKDKSEHDWFAVARFAAALGMTSKAENALGNIPDDKEWVRFKGSVRVRLALNKGDVKGAERAYKEAVEAEARIPAKTQVPAQTQVTVQAQAQAQTPVTVPAKSPAPAPQTAAAAAAEAGSESEVNPDIEARSVSDIPDTTPTPASVINSQGKVIVGPLLKTQWNQNNPYNKALPAVAGDRRVLVGCGPVVMAQLMKYHNHPKRGKGESKPYKTGTLGIEIPAVSFEVDYDWDNMLDTYNRSTNATERQQDAVAVLMYHAGVSTGTDYTPESSSGGGTGALINFFGYDKSLQRLSRVYYDDAAWEAVIKEQLDSGLPVWVNGRNKTGRPEAGTGHNFIIDGYDDKGKFHVNWGWGGHHDGYYSINALNPGRRDYNSENGLRINIRPDKGGIESYTPALDSFAVGKTAVLQNEQFAVAARISSQGSFPAGQAGVALVDHKDNIAAVVGAVRLGRRPLVNCFVPENVKPGQYSLRMVTRPTDGKWSIITLSNRTKNVPKAISFTVHPAEPGAKGGGYGLALAGFTANKTAVSQNELFTVSAKLKNINPSDSFPSGQYGAALIDNGGNIAAVVGISSNSKSLASGASRNVTLNGHVPESVAPGKYRLRTVVRPADGEWRVATLALDTIHSAIDFTLTAERGAKGGGYGLSITVFSTEKTSVIQKEPFVVSMNLKNIGTDKFPGGQWGTALVDSNGDIAAVIGTKNLVALGLGNTFAKPLVINCTVPDTVSPGQYRLRTVVRPTGEEWRVATLSAPNIPTSLDVTVGK